MSDYYILSDGEPLSVPFDEWCKKFNPITKRVAKTTITPEIEVSTVFLGINHRFQGYGPPVLWETMIFGGEHDQWQDRYTSLQDAKDGHEKACKIAQGDIKEEDYMN